MRARPLINTLLFFLAVTFLNWPLLGVATQKGQLFTYFYLYLAWTAIILILFFSSRLKARRSHKPK